MAYTRTPYILAGIMFALMFSINVQPTFAEDATREMQSKPTAEEIQSRRDTIESERKARLETVATRKDELQTERVQMTEERAAKQEAIKAQITERKLELITNRKERAAEFLSRASERFTQIADHLDEILARIRTKLDEAGDTRISDTAYTEIGYAQTALDEARDMIVALPDLADTLGDETSAREAIAQVKSDIQAIQDKLKEVHNHLMRAVQSIKSARSDKGDTATSTEE